MVAEGFRMDTSWFDALDDYVEDLQQHATDAANKTVDFVHEAIISYAKQKPNWVHLADDIKKWSIDGDLMIGFQHQDMASQAMAIEYGDMENPPDSLFRSLSSVSDQASDFFREEMKSRLPIRIPGVKG